MRTFYDLSEKQRRKFFSRNRKLNFEYLKFLSFGSHFAFKPYQQFYWLSATNNPIPCDMNPLYKFKQNSRERKVFLLKNEERNLYLNIELNMKIAIELNLKNKLFTCIHFSNFSCSVFLFFSASFQTMRAEYQTLFRLPRIYSIFPLFFQERKNFQSRLVIVLNGFLYVLLQTFFSSCKLKFHKQEFKEKPRETSIAFIVPRFMSYLSAKRCNNRDEIMLSPSTLSDSVKDEHFKSHEKLFKSSEAFSKALAYSTLQNILFPCLTYINT